MFVPPLRNPHKGGILGYSSKDNHQEDAMSDTTFQPKTGKWGDVKWIGIDMDSYALVGVGTTSRVLVDSRDTAYVTRSASGKGWDVVVLGEVVETCRLKGDAQGAVLYDWLGHK